MTLPGDEVFFHEPVDASINAKLFPNHYEDILDMIEKHTFILDKMTKELDNIWQHMTSVTEEQRKLGNILVEILDKLKDLEVWKREHCEYHDENTDSV